MTEPALAQEAAQDTPPASSEAPQAADSQPRQSGFSVVPIPIVAHAPETGWLIGGAAAFIVKPEDPELRTSNLVALLAYSTKHLAIAKGEFTGYFLRDRLFVGASVEAVRFPSKFYGIGNATELENEEAFVIDGSRSIITPMWLLAEDLYAGAIAVLHLNDLREAEAGGQLDTRAVRGAGGGRLVGMGVASKYDTRDNNLNASRGELISFDYAVYRATWGSQYPFASLRLDVRKFFPVAFPHVIATQLVLRAQHGDVPYFELNQLGGTYRLRGHFEGRYRDKLMLLTQVEYRFPIYWRFGGVAFGGAGDVASSLDDFFSDSVKFSAGAGLRVMLDRAERTNLTIDYGFSRDQSGLYINLGEVF